MAINWYESMRKGQDDQQDRYNAIADRQRAAELAAQADEDRETLNTYMAELRKLQLAEQNRKDAEAKRLVEEEKQNRLLAEELKISDAPYSTDLPVENSEGATISDWEAVPTYDVQGQVDANSAYKDEVAGIKTKMQADLEALKAKALTAKGEEKEVLNAQIAGLNKDLIEAENMQTSSVSEYAKSTADPDASSWEELLQGMDVQAEISGRLGRIQTFQPSKLWKFFLSKSKKEAVNIQQNVNVFAANYRYGGEWFENRPPEELAKFEKNPVEYLSANKKEIEKQTKMKLDHIPDKSEFDKVVNTEEGQVAKEADKQAIIADIKAEIGVVEGKLTTLQTSIDNYTLATDDGYGAEVKALNEKYKKLLDEAAEAKRVEDEERYNEIKGQLIESPLHKRLNIKAMGNDINRVVTARENYVQMFEHAQKVGNLENAQIYQAAIEAADLELWVEMNEQGLYELGLEGGSPQILEATMSEFLGGDVRLQRRSDGNWHVFDDGNLFRNSDADTNFWTHDQLADYSRDQVDDAYAAAKVAWQAKVANAKLEDVQSEHEKATLINDLIKEAMKIKGDWAKAMLESQGVKFSTANAETGEIIVNSGTNYWVWTPTPEIIDGIPQAETRQLSLTGILDYGTTLKPDGMEWLDAFIKEITKQTPTAGVQ